MKTKIISPKRELLRAFYHSNRGNFAIAAVLWVIGALFFPFASWALGAVTDAMAMKDMVYLRRIGIAILIAVPSMCAVSYLEDRAAARFIGKAVRQYKEAAFDKISRKGISAFSKEHTGRYLSALTNDINAIEQQYLERLLPMVDCCVSFLIALGMMLYYSPLLTFVVLSGSLLPALVSVLMGPRAAKLETEVSDANENFLSRIKDLLGGFAVLKSFKAEAEAKVQFDSANDAVEKSKRGKRNFAAMMRAAGNGSGLAMQMGMFVIGAILAIRGSINPGTVLAFVNMVNIVLRPIEQLPTFLASRKAAFALAQKLEQITGENTVSGGETIAPKLEKAISFDHVSFGYEEGKPVLKDLSFRFEAGKKYAIVGGSGSGKSTLLNLMMGGGNGYSGSLTIDGKELSGIDPDSLYDVMSLIGQNVFLFDDTIRRNITMFRDFPDGEVVSAVERSGLAGVLAAKGGDYRCGENGVGLSGGERQRISIARCLLRKTPVLMLDEATAALDNQTAFDVTEAVLRLEDQTCIVVTHRLEEALLRQYDGILVLRDGRIAEQGTFDALMAKYGYFYSLYHVTNGEKAA